jgi:hypothetical protein
MERDQILRDHLLEMLKGGHAHLSFRDTTANLSPGLRGTHAAPALPTAWQLLEHLRISQWDILEFSRDPGHVSPQWPEGYWPKSDAPPDKDAWDRSVGAFQEDLDGLVKLIEDPGQDLLKPFPHGDGQTLAREAVLAAVHNAYHLGQMVSARKLLGAWPPGNA